MKAYNNALDYLYGLEKFGIVFGLENIEWILDLLGNPHSALKVVHVGGTNGKGSVTCMMAGVLKEAGYRIGRYTSPHLVSFTERIAVNDREITEDEVADLTTFIRERLEAEDKKRFFTFFDFTTALAFEYFRRQEVDCAVVEVGLGGRLDSTNVVQPLVSVITNVAFDHMDYLGDSLETIAAEKAGIVKAGVPVVTGATDSPRRVVEETAKRQGSPLHLLGRDFGFEKTGDQRMSYKGLHMSLGDLFVNLKGDHQLANGAIALCATECLLNDGFAVTEDHVRSGFLNSKWQGRLEVIRENPTIILDAAHNPHGIRSIVSFMKDHYRGRKKIVVFGVMKDKEYSSMVKDINAIADVLIVTSPVTERALPPMALAALASDAIMTENMREALERAKSLCHDDDVVLVTGSFYTVGEAKTLIDEIF